MNVDLSEPKHDDEQARTKERARLLSELRNIHVNTIIAKVANLGEPDLHQLTLEQQATEIFSDNPRFVDEGFYSIVIDPRIIPILAESCGLDKAALANITLHFRPGQLGDKDYFGHPSGGYADGSEIHVLTSLPHYLIDHPEKAMGSIRTTHLKLKNEVIVTTLIHEIRHQIQLLLELFPEGIDSFGAIDHDNLLSEQDAIIFSEQIAQALSAYILPSEALSAQHSHQLSEDQRSSIPNNILQITDPEAAVTTMADYPKAHQLLKMIEELNYSMLADPEIESIFTELTTALLSREISIPDFNYLIKIVRVKCQDSGNVYASQMIARQATVILNG